MAAVRSLRNDGSQSSMIVFHRTLRDAGGDLLKSLVRSVWRRLKGRYARRIPVTAPARLHVSFSGSAMLHNTSCSALLVQGSPVASSDTSPP